MQLWRPSILVAVLVAFAGQAAVIYKWTDEKGVVHYSDQSVPGAEKIFTASSSNSTGASNPARSPNPVTASPSKAAATALNYTEMLITSPTQDQTFFGDELISINLALQPALKEGQAITWHLNGKQLADQGPTTTQFALQNLDRGSYVIAATILDQASGESQSSPTVNFFVRQPSALSPQHRRP